MAKIFNPGTVYIPNSGPEAERPRITGFGADMDTGRVTSYGQDAYGNLTDRTQYYGNADSDAMRMGYSQLMDAAETESRAAQRRRRTALTAMVGAAQKNGGLVPKPIMRQAAQDLGIPNAVGGVLTPEGNFALLGNNNGQIAPLGIVNPRMVMDAALDTGDADLADSFAKELGKHYTPDQLAAWGYTPQKTKAMRAQRAAAANEANQQKARVDALKVLSEIDKGNRPATFEDFIRALPKEVISGMSRGELEVDPEGNPVMDAEGNPLYKQATPAEIGQRLREIYDGSRGGGSQDDDGGELRNAIIGAVRGMFAPQPVDPRDAAMYDRAKQQEYIRSNPQSAFEIKGADGRSRYMNGWIVDGRLYDGRGNDVTDSLADGESVSDLTNGATYDFSAPAAQPAQSGSDELEVLKAERDRRAALNDGKPQSAQSDRPTEAPTPEESPNPMSAPAASLVGMASPAKAAIAPATAPASASVQTTPTPATPIPQTAQETSPASKRKDDTRRQANGMSARQKEILSQYKTVQDVAEDVVKSLVKNKELGPLANPDGTRRKLTAEEKLRIIHGVQKKFTDAGMRDFWEREVEEYTPSNYGARLSQDSIVDKLLRNWNNKTAPLMFGVAKQAPAKQAPAKTAPTATQRNALYRLRVLADKIGIEDPADFVRDPDGMMNRYGNEMDDFDRAAIRTLETAPDSIWDNDDK